MTGICAGRIAIVTGAGRGLGREHALELARQGAKVIVNDLGTSGSGEGASSGPAEQVVDEIRAMGGEAVANASDIADFEQAGQMVRQAIDTYGALDVLVNNAGFLRDRMLVNATEDEWDAVIRVHLKGHFAPLRHAAAYWRDEAKAGRPRRARIINTSSGAGLQGSIGQGTYSAAKAGIAGLTLVAAAELGRYGVTVNALAPAARTRMTEAAFAETMAAPEDGFDAMDPTERLAPGGLACQRGLRRRERSGDRVRGRQALRGGGLAARSVGRHRPPVGPRGRRAGRAGPARQGVDPGAGLRRLLSGRTRQSSTSVRSGRPGSS